jgi:hypothetical protein
MVAARSMLQSVANDVASDTLANQTVTDLKLHRLNGNRCKAQVTVGQTGDFWLVT